MPDRALILVDIQNDFVPGGALPAKDGGAIVPVVNELQNKFELIVASRDWHPREHVSFAINNPGKKVGDVIQLHGQPQVLWPPHCVQNTRGAEFVPSLHTEKVAHLVYKGIDPQIDSYSAFYDNGHLRATGLTTYLRDQHVRELFLVGLTTDYCVKFTALDGLGDGFKVQVITDGCRAVNLKPDDGQRAIEEMRKAGASIVQSTMVP